MSWQDQVVAVDPPKYDEPQDGPPRIWWRNGSKQARTPGVYFPFQLHPERPQREGAFGLLLGDLMGAGLVKFERVGQRLTR